MHDDRQAGAALISYRSRVADVAADDAMQFKTGREEKRRERRRKKKDRHEINYEINIRKSICLSIVGSLSFLRIMQRRVNI